MDQLAAYQGYLVSDYRSPRGQPLARSTLSTHVAVVRGFYRWLTVQGRIIADPSRRMELRSVSSRVVVRQPLTEQEVTALIQTQAALVTAAPSGTITRAKALRNLTAVCLALATGRRIGGMTRLRVDDLDLTRRELRVAREKGRMGRVLPVAAWAVEVVALYLREARPLLMHGDAAPWLFLSGAGDGPITRESLGWILDEMLARTMRDNPDLEELPSKRLSWHSLRVSFAKLLFSNGCDIRSVNELLLHTCPSTTARYTPIPVDNLRRAFRSAHPRP
jgi:site-specific recombinase XerD